MTAPNTDQRYRIRTAKSRGHYWMVRWRVAKWDCPANRVTLPLYEHETQYLRPAVTQPDSVRQLVS